jgi:hypothetical protein
MLARGGRENRTSLMKAEHTTAFQQMVLSMRQRLRPTKAHLFADLLRTYVGLNCAETLEHHLLTMLLQEVQPIVNT